MSVIMSKITPKRIEATSFALLAGISNFRGTIRGTIGTWTNDTFVGVSKEDLSNYHVLVIISFVCSFLPLFFIWLIPTKKEIDILQASMNEESDESQPKDAKESIDKTEPQTSEANQRKS